MFVTLPASLPAQRPDLSGRWTFNATRSDAPRDVTQTIDSSGDVSPPSQRGTGHSGGMPGVGGHFPGGIGGLPGAGGGGGQIGGMGGEGGGGGRPRGNGGGGGRPVSDETRAAMRVTRAFALNPPAVLTVTATDSTVTLAPDTGAALVVHSDGRKVKQQIEGGGEIEVQGRWDGHEFVVERKVSDGGKVTEKYRLSQDGKQLDVEVTLAGMKGRSLKFKRVYDRQ
jgi:hypothetical protein